MPLAPPPVNDPLWEAIERREGLGRLLRFAAGETLCREGEDAHFALVLLSGAVAVERGGGTLTSEAREGTFIGEISALAGAARTATVRATEDCTCGSFNAAELERFLVSYPDLALRLLKSMAERLVRESAGSAGGS
jgi:CRP-like cAMP-binding protein